MKREKVESSNVSEIGWERFPEISKKGVLEVLFKDGGLYHYWPITREMWKRLMEAESKGGFLRERIMGKVEVARCCQCPSCERGRLHEETITS